jgi:hypothetical protein
MGLSEDNVRVVTSLGARCFVCDQSIKEGEKAIEVSFSLIIQVRKEMHPVGCADRLCDLLRKRETEARK